MKILSNKKYNDLILKSCRGMFGAVTDDMLLRSNSFLNEDNERLQKIINKAISFIEQACYINEDKMPSGLGTKNTRTLYKILKGDNNE